MPFAKLDSSRIRTAALRLFRDSGLDGVSVRRLAASLGVGPSSLYWHVRDRDALYAMLTEDVFAACIAATPPANEWREWLRGFGLALWEAQRLMPDIRTLIVRHPAPDERRAAMRAGVVEALASRGLPLALAEPAQHSVQALVTGWTTLGPGTPDERTAFTQVLDVLIEGWCARRESAVLDARDQAA